MPKQDWDKHVGVWGEAIKKAKIEELDSILDTLDRESRNEVMKAISGTLTQDKKGATLERVRRHVSVAEDDLKGWTVNSVSEAYAEGINLADKQLRQVGISGVPKQKVTVEEIKKVDDLLIHKQAVNALASDAYLDFGNAMNGLVRGAEHQLNNALKRQLRAKTLKGQLTGQSIDEIKNELEEVLSERGFSVLKDRAGSEWTLKSYGQMLARTHIIKSGNEGTINRAGEFDTDIVQVSTHGGACSICVPYEGRTYSISGNSKKYPKLAIELPIHPNCRHSWELRPDLS